MPNPPKDPYVLKRILDRLAAIGWIKQSAFFEPTETQRGGLRVEFTEKGLAHIRAFKELHEELGDITDYDRHFLYDHLLVTMG